MRQSEEEHLSQLRKVTFVKSFSKYTRAVPVNHSYTSVSLFSSHSLLPYPKSNLLQFEINLIEMEEIRFKFNIKPSRPLLKCAHLWLIYLFHIILRL